MVAGNKSRVTVLHGIGHSSVMVLVNDWLSCQSHSAALLKEVRRRQGTGRGHGYEEVVDGDMK